MINAAFAQAAKVTNDANFSFPNLNSDESDCEGDEAEDVAYHGCIDGAEEFRFEGCTCEAKAVGGVEVIGYCQCYYDDIDRRLAEAATAERADDHGRSELLAASDSIQPPFMNPSDWVEREREQEQEQEQYFGCINGDLDDDANYDDSYDDDYSYDGESIASYDDVDYDESHEDFSDAEDASDASYELFVY